MNLDWLSKEQLKDLLKDLSLYKTLSTQIWKRWTEIFSHLKEWKNKFSVEFFPNLEKNFVLEESKKIFSKIFWKNPSDWEISLKENKKILWWMKIFFNDDMIDMSFLKFQKIIKN